MNNHYYFYNETLNQKNTKPIPGCDGCHWVVELDSMDNQQRYFEDIISLNEGWKKEHRIIAVSDEEDGCYVAYENGRTISDEDVTYYCTVYNVTLNQHSMKALILGESFTESVLIKDIKEMVISENCNWDNGHEIKISSPNMNIVIVYKNEQIEYEKVNEDDVYYSFINITRKVFDTSNLSIINLHTMTEGKIYFYMNKVSEINDWNKDEDVRAIPSDNSKKTFSYRDGNDELELN